MLSIRLMTRLLKHMLPACLALLILIQSSSAKPTPDRETVRPRQLVLTIPPIERGGAMYERFLPLKYYLEKTFGVPVVIRIGKDYESLIQEIGEGRAHLACVDPSTYCEIRARYKRSVVPLVKAAGGSPGAKSVLVVKEGSSIERIADLKGKKVALGSRESSFSYLVPLAMLHDVGLKTSDLSTVDFLQQEDRVALSVLIGDYHAGGISESVARKYIPDGLKIIKTSEAIAPFVICASTRIDPKFREAIADALHSIPNTDVLTSIDKNIGRFDHAGDRDFDVVRIMIKNLTGKNYIEYGPATIKVAILPLYSAITIYERYDPIMSYLSRKTGREFKLVIPKDFDDFVRVVTSGKVNFSYQNPYIFALIGKHSEIRPLVTTLDDRAADGEAGGGLFRGVIITRSDSSLRSAADLRNKRVMITSPKSAGGFLSQKIYLRKLGLDTDRDMKIVDAKRQENVILGVYRGEADAGFVREAALDVVKSELDMKKIRIIAKTDPLPNWPFAAAGKPNPALEREIRRLLLDLREKSILSAARIKGFKKADEAEFEALRKY